MIRNKYIILPFLLLSWTIIFTHSIVPHHHEVAKTECNHSHTKQYRTSQILQIHDCHHDCSDHVCHFNVETITQVTIDNVIVPNTVNSLFADIICIKSNNYNYYQEFISDQIPKTDHLRGPPVIS